MEIDAITSKGKWKGKGKKSGKGKDDHRDGSRPEKGKGKDKSGKTGKGQAFDGECLNCRKYGHRKRDCWAPGGGAFKPKGANVVEDQTPKQQDMNVIERWVMSIEQKVDATESDRQSCETFQIGDHDEVPGEVCSVSDEAEELLVDSGCYDHCCPPSFALEYPTMRAPPQHATAASKQPLTHFGQKTVPGHMLTNDGVAKEVLIRFNVFDVKRPILSTNKLRSSGFTCVHSPNRQYIAMGDKQVSVFNKNGLPFVQFWPLCAQGEVNGMNEEHEVETTGSVSGSKEPMVQIRGGDVIDSSHTSSDLDVEAQRARGILVPKGPADTERRHHELTHMPYRSWCAHCVRGRGKESPHVVKHELGAPRDESWPVVQADYAFMHSFGDSDDKVTILTVVDTLHGSIIATACPKKGGDPFVESVVRAGLENMGLTADIILQTDKENGPIDLIRRIAAARKGRSQIRQTPKGSSTSNAYVERTHQSTQGLVKTMKDVVDKKCGVRVRADSAITAWMVRHAAWLISRFAIGSDGRSAFQRQHNIPYSGKNLPFGSVVEAKLADKERLRSKFDSSFVTGVYLGRSLSTDEHCVGAKKGIVTVRTIRIYDAVTTRDARHALGRDGRGGRRRIQSRRPRAASRADERRFLHRDGAQPEGFLGEQGQDLRLQGM